MESTPENKANTPSKYWQSLEQWRQDPEFLELAEKEFRSSPLVEDEGQGGWARREFLKLMGASLALTSFGCMRRPAQMIVPYAKKPSELLHGAANYYASTFTDIGGEALGILVTSRDGRPVKIEGNTEHPANRGGMSARAHAHILSLYDPERLSGPRRNLFNDKKTNRETVSVKFEDADSAIAEQLKKGGVAILSGGLASPSTKALVGEFTQSTNGRAYYWDAMGFGAISEGQNVCYGRSSLPHWRFDKASYVLAVNCDFLGAHITPTMNARKFSRSRKADKDMAKLVVFESLMSLTGSNADERYRIGAGQDYRLIMTILRELIVVKRRSRYAGDSNVERILNATGKGSFGLPEGRLEEIVEGLWANRGRSLVVAGNFTSSLQLQVAANFLNTVLENDGVTVDYDKNDTSYIGSSNGLANVITDLKAGKIKTLLIHRCNPGYSAVASEFVEAVKKAEMVIYTGDRLDETGVFADYVIPDHHLLENWDDAEVLPGAYSVQQPTIQPLYQTRAFQDSLLSWMKAMGKSGLKDTWYDYLVNRWERVIWAGNRGRSTAATFTAFWQTVLNDGIFETVGNRESSSGARGFNTSALSRVSEASVGEGYQLDLYATVGLRDGTLANVSWLQEFPDPVTKICWDNYLTMSPADAAKENLKEGDTVNITRDGKTLEAPVHIQPGQADGVLGLAIGYGRTRAGKVANNVGQNAYHFIKWNEDGAVAGGMGTTVKKTGRGYKLACTQDHHSMEGRQIVVEATLAQYMKDPGANIHRHKMITMWSEHKYPNEKWGMSIDLNSCTGCGACVIACQSENNIPTVGKKHVLNGREMHWMRIDRYYVGEPNDPAVVHQPIVCMHCDNAPCETVCPVMATAHSSEGTNDMIYNRCVGTRYCSNNCPYKVRRFNWFNYVKEVEKPLNYAMNPDVTVRARGVMEKCTFCIHRIRHARLEAKVEDRQLKDGDVITACQQSCPTSAITFGDLNNPESMVHKKINEKNAYELLEELNTKPAVKYLSKVRHTDHMKGESHGHGGGHGSSEHKEGQHS